MTIHTHFRSQTLFQAFLALGVFFVGATVSVADTVVLKSGGRIEGVLVAQTADRLTMDVSVGRISIDASSVKRVEKSVSRLAEFQRRRDALSATRSDVDSWIELAEFASRAGLKTQAALAWREVLKRDPDNLTANRELGRTLVGNEWMNEDEANRARGLVLYQGSWVTPAERDTLRRDVERAEDAERRVREARREAQEAEERARRAEREAAAARSQAQSSNGVLVVGPGYGYGGYGYGPNPCLALPCGGATNIWVAPPPAPVPTPLPPIPPIRPSSIR